MDNSIKDIGKIRDSIISGKLSESRLREIMDKAKNEYGEDVFKPYDLNSVRQYVYTKPYYERLVQLAKNGACSQEFFIHLLRVRDSIKKQKLKKMLIVVFFLGFLCISVLSLGISLWNNTLLKNIEVYESPSVSVLESLKTEDSNILENNEELVNTAEKK